MVTLLTRVRDRLKDQISYVPENDIFITVDENVYKASFHKYCIGIKDGGLDITHQTTDEEDWAPLVDIIIWVRLHKEEATIIGDAGSDDKGILYIMADVFTALDYYYLPNSAGSDYTDVSMSQGCEPSELFGDEDTSFIQKLKCTMQYNINKTS